MQSILESIYTRKVLVHPQHVETKDFKKRFQEFAVFEFLGLERKSINYTKNIIH